MQTPIRWRSSDHNGSFDFPPPSPTTPADLLAGVDCVPNRNCSGGFVPGTLSGDRAEGDVVMTIPDPVPVDGAKVDHLHLDITHREQGNDVAESHVWISGGLPPTHQVQCDLTDPSNSLPTADDFQTDGYDCDMSDVELPYFAAGDLTVTYQVQLKNRREGDPERTADVALDAVQLSAVFARPSARTSAPSGAILQLDSAGAIHALGTVYLPNGDVSLDFGRSTTSNFGRGVVVKSIDVSGSPERRGLHALLTPGRRELHGSTHHVRGLPQR